MPSFFPARGCVYRVGNGGVGSYAISGLSGSDIVITGAPASDTDAIQPVLGLGGKKLIYTFGSGFGNIQITGIVLLGPAGSSSSTPARLFGYFETNRVANSKTAVNISVPGNVYRAYLTGFGLSAPDPEYHIQSFAFSGILAKPR